MNKTIPLLLLAFGAAHGTTETITGFCRESGSLNIIPFTLNTTTGAMTTLPAWSIGPDRAGHYSSSVDDTGKILITGVQPTGTGATPEQIVTVDTTSGTVTPSANGLSNASFSGNSVATIPNSSPWSVMVAQAGPGTAALPTTSVYQIEVASGAIQEVDAFDPTTNTNLPSTHYTVPYTGANAPRSTVARFFFELDGAAAAFGYLLQPCIPGGPPQQLARIDLNSMAQSSIDLNVPASGCVDAPGLLFGQIMAIGSFYSGYQLVYMNFDDGSVDIVADAPAGWRRAPMSPYVYSAQTGHLYALNDAQNSIAVFDPNLGSSLTPITVASPCARGSITSFASVH